MIDDPTILKHSYEPISNIRNKINLALIRCYFIYRYNHKYCQGFNIPNKFFSLSQLIEYIQFYCRALLFHLNHFITFLIYVLNLNHIILIFLRFFFIWFHDPHIHQYL